MSNWKTYLLTFVGMIVSVLFAAEIIGAKTFAWLMALLGSGTGAAIRHGIAKVEVKAEKAATRAGEAAVLAAEAAASADLAAKKVG